MKQTLLACLLALCAPLVLADDAAPRDQGSYKINKLITRYSVNADATSSETYEASMTALNEQGTTQLNHADINYNSSMETLTVIEAYTLKKDGSRIDVPVANIQDRDVISDSGPMYGDFKARLIIFPTVEVGDSVVYSVRSDQKVPMFPGQFSLMESFSSEHVVDDQEVFLETPLHGLTLQTVARGIEGGRLPDADGKARWHWSWHNAAPATDKTWLPPDEAPALFVSSFRNFAALAAAYEQRAHPQAAVTPDIQTLADRLTQGIDKPADQARTLYNWVARNIRYVGNCIGVGSAVPHDAGMVLQYRLGDCKDHTALLQALLAARGIASTPVLVNSGALYGLPPLPVPGFFNHVINYIPSLDIYADSTGEFVPFGSLPPGETSKMVLPTENFHAPLQTPAIQWDDYESHLNVHTVIQADGGVISSVNNTDSPLAAALARQSFARMDAATVSDYVKHWLTASGLSGTGSLMFDDPHGSKSPYAYGIIFHADNVFDLPGGGAFQAFTPFGNGKPLSSWVRYATSPPVHHAFRCSGSKSVEDYRYDLPAGLKILWLPHDVSSSGGGARYEATYRQEGQSVVVHRQLEYRIDSHTCTPEEYEAVRPVAAAVAKDLRAQILYELD